MGEQIFKSIGIDIGTSTTKIIFSQFHVTNQAPMGFTAEIEISNKQILYKSPIYFTPLFDDNTIDFPNLKTILDKEFLSSKISRDEIQTGAVIITGESARKYNSKEVINHLAEYAGNFVVAIAGPDIEAILAGYGSGAAELAQRTGKRVMNINIGGGTTNIVIFNGDYIDDTFALDIGGRLIRYNENTQIQYISSRLEPILTQTNISLSTYDNLNVAQIQKLTDQMAKYLFLIVSSQSIHYIPKNLFLEHYPKEIDESKKIDIICFSGGVAEFIYDFLDLIQKQSPTTEIKSFPKEFYSKYQDIGIYLAESIAKTFFREKKSLLKIRPDEKIRATVIGAGSNSISLSGSTICVENIQFPMKNIPIISIPFDYEQEKPHYFSQLKESLTTQLHRYHEEKVAVWIKGSKTPTYNFVKQLAIELVDIIDTNFMVGIPIIILLEYDFAKALGQSIQNRLKKPHPLIILDKIKIGFGNYVDIGEPIMGVVPIVLKTMLFNSKGINKNLK